MKHSFLHGLLSLVLTTGVFAQNADLYVAQNDGGVEVPAGGTVVYAIDYGNLGPDRAEAVELLDIVPDHSRFDTAASTPGWSCVGAGLGGDLCTLLLGDLDAGTTGSASFVVRLDPVAAGVLENAVAISATTADPDPTNDVAFETTPVVGPGNRPDLGLAKTGDGSLPRAGDTVAYTLSVVNNGNQGAAGVEIIETVPLHSVFAPDHSTPGWLCDPADGAPGASCTLDVGSLAGAGDATSAIFAVTLADPLAAGVDQISNTASVTDDGTSGADLDPTDNVATAITPIDPATAPDLVLAKDDGGVTADAGETVVYTLSATNLGDQDASGVVLSETVPNHTTFDPTASSPGWSCAGGGSAGSPCSLTLGLLAGRGGSASLAYAVRLDSSLPAGVDRIVNRASLDDDGASGPDQNPLDNLASDETPLGSGVVPDLNIAITDDDATADAGQPVLYRIDFGNAGARGASGVRVTALLPSIAGYEPLGSSPGWSCAGASCSIDLGTVMGGELGSLDLVLAVVDPLPAGVQSLVVTVSISDDGANGPDLDPADNTAEETTPIGDGSAPDLAISKDDGQVVADAGDLLSYAIAWQNLGNRGASGVVIVETVPAHTTFEPTASDPGWRCSGGGGPGSVCVLDLGTLESGAPRGSAPFSVRVDSFVPAGVEQIVNQVTIEDDGANGDDPDLTNNQAVDQTTLGSGGGGGTAPDLSLTLSDGGASVEPAGVVVYTVSYANNGNQGASGVTITLTVPQHTTFEPDASSTGWSCVPDHLAGSQCSLGVDALDSGPAGGAVFFAARVDGSVPSGVDAIVVEGSITDDGLNGPDQSPADNLASDTTPLLDPGEVDLAVELEGFHGAIDAGQRMVYTLRYANHGDRNAHGVRLRLSLPQELLIDTRAGSQGWSCRPTQTAPRTACALTLGSLAAEDHGEATLAVRLDDPLPAGLHRLVSLAVIVDDGTAGPDANPSDNRSREITPVGTGPGGVGTAPDLALELDDGDPDLRSGDLVTYTLTVSNQGNQAATGIQLAALLPPHSTHEPGDDTPGWQCAIDRGASAGGNDGEDGYGAEELCNLALGHLEGGEEIELTLTVRLDEPLPAAVLDLVFLAAVEDDGSNGPDQNPDDNLAEETTHIGPTGPKRLTITSLLVEMVQRLVGVLTRLTDALLQLVSAWIAWMRGLGKGW